MNECHQVAPISDHGGLAFTRSSVDGYVFSDDVIVSNFEKGRFSPILFVLWIAADDGTLGKNVARSNFGARFDRYVGIEDATVADLNTRFNVAKRPDDNIVADLGCIVNGRERVNGQLDSLAYQLERQFHSGG